MFSSLTVHVEQLLVSSSHGENMMTAALPSHLPPYLHSSHFTLTFFGEEWFMCLILHVQSIGISCGFHNSGNHWKRGCWSRDKSIKITQSCVHARGYNVEEEQGFVWFFFGVQIINLIASLSSLCCSVEWNCVVLEDRACCSPQCPVVMSGRALDGWGAVKENESIMTQGHGCRKQLRKCLCVCLCLRLERVQREREKGQRESPGSWGLALLPLEMLCILLIRAWVALRLAEHSSGGGGEEHPSDTTSHFHAPVPPSLPGGPEDVTPCERFILQPSPKTRTSRPPSVEAQSSTALLFFFAHGWSDTCGMSDGDMCVGKQQEEQDEKHEGTHCFYSGWCSPERQQLTDNQTKMLNCSITVVVLLFNNKQRCFPDKNTGKFSIY